MNKMTLFNTRSEELMNKPMFNKMMKNNRGVVVLDGFYEFVANGKGRPKTKYMITPLKEQYFIVPVLFNNKGCFTMLTQPPVTEIFRTIHERQPVILSESQLFCWIYINEKEMQYDNIRDVDKSLNTFKLHNGLNLVAA
jgi:putative SOS response-associated peptidase YedK